MKDEKDNRITDREAKEIASEVFKAEYTSGLIVGRITDREAKEIASEVFKAEYMSGLIVGLCIGMAFGVALAVVSGSGY